MNILTEPRMKEIYDEINNLVEQSKNKDTTPTNEFVYDYYEDNIKHVLNTIIKEVKKDRTIIASYEAEIIEFLLFLTQYEVTNIFEDLYFLEIESFVGKYLLFHFMEKMMQSGMEPFDAFELTKIYDANVIWHILCMIEDVHKKLTKQ